MSHARLAALAFTLLACSTPRLAAGGGELARSGPYSLEVIDEYGRLLPTFHHRGRTYVLGTHGARYLLRIGNRTGGRIEVVASVDGRDVIDGKPASVSRPGYLVPAWGEVVIDGFRLSRASVAAFRFSTVEGSYAGRMGDARDVGVIGAAIFTEEPPPPRPTHVPPETSARRDDAGRAGGKGGEAAPPSSSDRAAGVAPTERWEERSGLGTGFGERHESRVVEVAFERASSTPATLLSLRYDDRPGLLALGIDVDGARWPSRDKWLRETAEPFRGDGFAEPPPGWVGG